MDKPELDGEPEQPGKRGFVLGAGVQRCLAVGLEELRKHRIGVQRHVAEDIVEDVRLGQVVEFVWRANRDRRRELPLRKAGKEALGRQVPGHGAALPAR